MAPFRPRYAITHTLRTVRGDPQLARFLPFSVKSLAILRVVIIGACLIPRHISKMFQICRA